MKIKFIQVKLFQVIMITCKCQKRKVKIKPMPKPMNQATNMKEAHLMLAK